MKQPPIDYRALATVIELLNRLQPCSMSGKLEHN